MKISLSTAHELATKYAQGIWWARTPILSYHDHRLNEGQTAPAVWCDICEEVYAELPNNKSPYTSAAEAAPSHIKDAHLASWKQLIAQAELAIRASSIWWADRRKLHDELRPKLVENPLFKHRMKLHLPCPTGCGTTLHEYIATDQIKGETTLIFTKDVIDDWTIRMAEHLMRHSKDQLRAIIEPTTN